VPTDNESERVEQSERTVRQSLDATPYQERSQTVRLSPDEERGPVATNFAGIWVRPSRYCSIDYDPALVKASLSKVESRLNKYDETIQELKAMKSQVARNFLLLESELRNRSHSSSSLSTHALLSSSPQPLKSPGQKPRHCATCQR